MGLLLLLRCVEEKLAPKEYREIYRFSRKITMRFYLSRVGELNYMI